MGGAMSRDLNRNHHRQTRRERAFAIAFTLSSALAWPAVATPVDSASSEATQADSISADSTSGDSTAGDSTLAIAMAEHEAEQVLPSPPRLSPGTVPLSEPVAPVPPGPPAWEVSAGVSSGIADAFWSKVAFTGSVRRAVGFLSVEGFGGAFLSWSNPGLTVCGQPSSCAGPGGSQLGATPGRLMWMGGAGASIRAAEGKVSLAGLVSPRFAFHAGLGAAAVGYRAEDGGDPMRVGPGARLSLALQSSVLTGFDARLELASLVYASHVRGRWAPENQLLIGLGMSWRPGAQP